MQYRELHHFFFTFLRYKCSGNVSSQAIGVFCEALGSMSKYVHGSGHNNHFFNESIFQFLPPSLPKPNSAVFSHE